MSNVDRRRNELAVLLDRYDWPVVHRSEEDYVGPMTLVHGADDVTFKLEDFKVKTVKVKTGRDVFDALVAERKRLDAASRDVWPKLLAAWSTRGSIPVRGWKALVALDPSFPKQKVEVLYTLSRVRDGRFPGYVLSTSPPTLAQQRDAVNIPSAMRPNYPDRAHAILLLQSRGRAAGRSTKLRAAQRRVAQQWQGLSRHHPLKDYPRAEIERGADVEIEHVGYRPIARRIAADHLTEDRAYYDKLAKMEGRAAGRALYFVVEGLSQVSPGYSGSNAAIENAENLYRFHVARGRSSHLPVSVVRAHSMSEAAGFAEFANEPFARPHVVWRDGVDPRQTTLPFGRAAGRRPKGTPTSGDHYCLHVEMEAHAKREGSAEPLHAFAATCVGAMRKMVKAGYLVPAPGHPRGYWRLSALGAAEHEQWMARHRGLYGIPAND